MSNQSKITALVINLNSAKERWDFQQKQLNKLGIEYQRWEANSVDSLTNDDYEKWANDWQRKLRRTEVACFLSHYRAWQYIANSGKSFLILEDDAILSQYLPNVLIRLSADQTLEYHHLTFETRGRKKLISKQGTNIFENVALHRLFLDKTGAAAYLLTPEGANILINEVAQHGAALADALLCHTKALKKMQVVPALAIQMDMANHYQIEEQIAKKTIKSTISNTDFQKPTPNNLFDLYKFKQRRLTAQFNLAITQAKFIKNNLYIEIKPDI